MKTKASPNAQLTPTRQVQTKHVCLLYFENTLSHTQKVCTKRPETKESCQTSSKFSIHFLSSIHQMHVREILLTLQIHFLAASGIPSPRKHRGTEGTQNNILSSLVFQTASIQPQFSVLVKLRHRDTLATTSYCYKCLQ